MIEIGKNTFQRYLWNIYKGGYSGVLLAERNKIRKEIFFDKGIPVGARSNILDEYLGRLLVSEGFLSEDKCSDSLILKKGLNARQGDALIRMGLLKKEQISEFLKLQLRSRMMDLFAWDGGVFRFRFDEVSPDVRLDERVGKLIIEGVTGKHPGLEKELRLLDEMVLKENESFKSVLKDFGLRSAPFKVEGKRIDQITSQGRDAAALLYSFLLTDAVTFSLPIDKSPVKVLSEQMVAEKYQDESGIRSAAAEFKKGKSSLSARNFEGAFEYFRRAVDLKPEEGEYYAYLGWALFNKPGRTGEAARKAKEYVGKAIEMNHRIAMPYYFLGYMLRVEGSLDAALKEFDKALKLDPKLVEPQREMRLIHITREQVTEKGKGKKILNMIFK